MLRKFEITHRRTHTLHQNNAILKNTVANFYSFIGFCINFYTVAFFQVLKKDLETIAIHNFSVGKLSLEIFAVGPNSNPNR